MVQSGKVQKNSEYISDPIEWSNQVYWCSKHLEKWIIGLQFIYSADKLFCIYST